MTTLLVALGILASFGALFWLDRYYKDDGNGRENHGPDEPDGEDKDSASGPV
ncbi:MAG: hypothetical protein AB1598_14330 [Thermodesulfobacteriota bacterium]